MLNTDLVNLVGTILLILIVTIIVFLLCRELICWYFKINKTVVLLEDQNDLLRKLLENQSGKENQNGIGDSEVTDSGISKPEV